MAALELGPLLRLTGFDTLDVMLRYAAQFSNVPLIYSRPLSTPLFPLFGNRPIAFRLLRGAEIGASIYQLVFIQNSLVKLVEKIQFIPLTFVGVIPFRN
ncbi:hypothetical protein [Neogemmobacter tilapiae]|uniref:Uncharacterized protein n=1 Tax=Neogemmobacter tilapiae TaxID=875041 RepID=A0A918WPA2_9RHOB|nr:hypothetical protein GCM10007315_31740 [Gemmobacter tilapiae]